MNITKYDAIYTTSPEEEVEIKDLLANSGRSLQQAVEQVLPWLKGCDWVVDVSDYPQIITILYNPSKAMIEQRDAVDNECYQLALTLAGVLAEKVEWDMEHIGEIRDTVLAYLVAKTGYPEHTFYV